MAPQDRQPNWQPISALPQVATVIDGQLHAARDQHRLLLKALERPHRLDDATVERVRRVFADTAAGLDLYDEQLRLWVSRPLTLTQRAEVERLAAKLVSLGEVVGEILALAERIKLQTIEALAATNDLEVGLDWILRPLEWIGTNRSARARLPRGMPG